MKSVIIDSTYQGKRISVSIDEYMFSLYKLQHPDAVKRVRDSIKRGYSLNSKQARDMILASIVKPSLVAKSLSEAQMDIEDV